MASQAQIRASAKWNAGRDAITIRVEKETGAKIRGAAAASGVSVTQYILDAVDGKPTAPASGGGVPGLNLSAVREHVKQTGETESAFLSRAVKDTIDRDNTLLKFGIKPEKK